MRWKSLWLFDILLKSKVNVAASTQHLTRKSYYIIMRYKIT